MPKAGVHSENDNRNIQIFVKDPNGRTISICLSAMETVESVKQQLQYKTGIPQDEQLLIFSGKPLKNGLKLSDYNIKNESTLHLHSRLYGGGKNKGKQTSRMVTNFKRTPFKAFSILTCSLFWQIHIFSTIESHREKNTCCVFSSFGPPHLKYCHNHFDFRQL